MAEKRTKQDEITRVRKLVEGLVGGEEVVAALDEPIAIRMKIEAWAIIQAVLGIVAEVIPDHPNGKDAVRLAKEVERQIEGAAEERGKAMRKRNPDLRKPERRWEVLDVMEKIEEERGND